MVIILALLVHKNRVDDSQQKKCVSTQKNSDFSHKKAQIEGGHQHLPTKILPTPQGIDKVFFWSVPFFLEVTMLTSLALAPLKTPVVVKGLLKHIVWKTAKYVEAKQCQSDFYRRCIL